MTDNINTVEETVVTETTLCCDRCDEMVAVTLNVNGVCPKCGLEYVWDMDNDGEMEWPIVSFRVFENDEDDMAKSAWDDHQSDLSRDC